MATSLQRPLLLEPPHPENLSVLTGSGSTLTLFVADRDLELDPPHQVTDTQSRFSSQYIDSACLEPSTLQEEPVKYHEAWQKLCSAE